MTKYPIGPETTKRARKTLNGQLALVLNRVLYEGYVTDVSIPDGGGQVKRWIAPIEVYAGDDGKELPDFLKMEGREKYVSTEALLREVRDRLEYLSLREVIP